MIPKTATALAAMYFGLFFAGVGVFNAALCPLAEMLVEETSDFAYAVRGLYQLNGNFFYAYLVLAIVALAYSAVASVWTVCHSPTVSGTRRVAQRALVLFGSALLALPLVFLPACLGAAFAAPEEQAHSMTALEAVKTGIAAIPNGVLASFPFNVLSFVLGYELIRRLDGWWHGQDRVGFRKTNACAKLP